jgi:hypothetical protein
MGMIGFEMMTGWEFLFGQRSLTNHFGTAAAKAAA